MNKIQIQLTVNGNKHSLKVAPNKRLLDILREDLNLTGTKEGCDVGECGACTVVMNGQAVHSCLVLALQADGAEILTVEGLANRERLHPLQTNFLQYGAVQCGFCIPGMLMSSYALLEENPHPNEDEIKEAIAGNLCRCTGYKQIIQAVEATVETTKNK